MTRDEAVKDFNRRRLAAMDRVRRDGRLSASIRAVGAELFSKVDMATGDAYPSEEYLHEKLHLSPRTVKMAVKALQECGYFVVVKRGRNNRYQPIFEPVEKVQNLHLSEDRQGQNLHLSGADRCKNSPEQVQKTSGNRCKKGPPTSLVNSLGLLGEAGEGVGAPDGAAAPSFDLGLPGVALRQRLGDEVFKAWLGKVAVVSIEGNQLVLSAPTKFIAMRIDRDHGAAILECWRVQHPQIQRLEVIVAGATAPAATPISNRRAPSQVVDARWLLEEGRTIVRERLFVADDVAQGRLVEWLKRCGNDAAGLRQVITAADQQDLVGDRFRAIVQRQVEALLHGGQGALKFGPEAVVKRRSAS